MPTELPIHTKDNNGMKRKYLAKSVMISWILITALLGTGCGHFTRSGTASASLEQTTWTRAEIICGLNKAAGGTVTDSEWQKFMDEEVTPRFPNGLTVLAGVGQWKGTDGNVEQESCRMIILFYDSVNDKGADQRIYHVAEAYGQQFGQETVLLSSSKAIVEFVPGGASK
jgi:hypothetical protein